MKDQILKIAKVKSEKEFYKKYPSEEAFMKAHGKAFKKAAMGSKMVNDQLHQLTEWEGAPKFYGGGSADPLGNITNVMGWGNAQPAVQPATYNKWTGLVGGSKNAAGQEVVTKAATDAAFGEGNIPEGAGGGGIQGKLGGAGMAALGALPGIIAGAEAIGAQKKGIKKANQASQLSGLAAQAAGMREKVNRKYVRPEDSLVQPGQLGNPYGTGTNYLAAENGTMIGGNPTQIQNTYAPTGNIYQDLGFEPLEETYKQYRHGGEMPKAELGEYFQDSGQAQIGSAAGSAIGNMILPGVGGAIGGLIGKVGGNLLGGAKDARELKKYQNQTEANQQQAAWQNTLQGQFSGFMKDGGKVGDEYKWVSHTWQPQTIAKFGDYDVKDLLKPPHDADMLRSGGHLAQVHYTPPSAEALFTGRPDMPHAQNGYGRWTKVNNDPSSMTEIKSTLPPMKDPKLSHIKSYTQLNTTDTNHNGESKYNKDFTHAIYSKDEYGDGTPSQQVYSYGKDNGDKYSEFVRTAPEGGEARNELHRIEARRPFLNLLGKKQSMERFDKLDEAKAQGYLQQMHESLPGGLPGYTPANMNTGGRLPSTNMMFDTDRYPRAKNGTQLAMGGDLEVGDGGHLETLSYNPNLPGGEIGMFRGASHDNGGIKTKYGENEVEVEGNEPVVKLQDGGSTENLVVFGNIKINKEIADLMGDPKAKGKKFKTYIADVAKNDAKQLKKMNKALDLIENADENSAFDHLTLNTGNAMLQGTKAWQKINAEKIKQAGIVQDAIHKTANELGVKSDRLAEGKLEKETDPSMMAQNGITLLEQLKGLTDEELMDPEHPERMEALKAYMSGNKKAPYQNAQSPSVAPFTIPTFGKTKESKAAPKSKEAPYKYTLNKKYKTGKEIVNAIMEDALKGVPKSQYADDEFIQIPFERGRGNSPELQEVVVGGNRKQPVSVVVPPTAPVAADKKRFDWKGLGMAALSYAEPWLRPSNANEPLPPDQLYPEYFALANNQLEPVQAQTFQPMLDNPYDISLNDQLNAVDSQSRAAIRASGNNPAAQAQIMAQSLEAKNRVLGEQNRINQANKMQVYDKNRALLNDAQLKNLAILDQQYVRQSQAKSNTKQQAMAALSSIAAKTAQQRATNRKLAIIENMYNFRFSPSGRAYNLNAPAQFDLSGSGSGSGYSNSMLPANKRFTIDPVTKKIAGIMTLTKEEMAGNTPSLSELDNFLDNQKNGGKTPKTKARNSSIVKALKNL